MLQTRLDHLLEKFVANGPTGVGLSVQKESQVIYENYIGYANLEKEKKVTANTIYRIYSMSKIVTCVAALQLWEKGEFLLTDPLSDYLPEFKEMDVLVAGKLVKAESPITIKDLFTMTSGITYGGDGSEVERMTSQVMQEVHAIERQKEVSQLRLFAEKISNNPLAFHPGTHWRYGLSHDVLGALIEVITGLSFAEYLNTYIFTPLQMKDTFFQVPIEKKHRLATFYQRDEDGVLIENTWIDEQAEPVPIMESGGAGLHSTLGDYQKFAHCLALGGSYDGARIISNPTLDLMVQNHLPEEMLPEFGLHYQHGYGYGLGVRVMIDQTMGGSNSSIGEFGWPGFAGTYTSIDRNKQVSAVYMQQMLPSLEFYHQPRIRNVIYSAIE
ncbi:beta-lactamase family protein [Gracilibacillus caseinilyticus]|uniref:Beta-lactamase family protein n=1 Tax=Gracilibacillus caseinilyticus TaxID=2932256 RepID=A0ABY4EY37_9BACI|nr:serine hydrolase domain-containing protein [Gracilibacillus caseinilyticus]UOQ47081.1 beta-lactamase family protein [Gracilibacillus caseinilyticus]